MGVTKRLLAHPDSAGLPDLVSLAPTTFHSLGLAVGEEAAGRGGQLTGEPGPASPREDTVPGRVCSTKDHMASFCMELLDKGVGGEWEAARRHPSRGTGPAPLRQQAGGWGRTGAPSPCVCGGGGGWVLQCSCLPSLHSLCTGRVCVTASYSPGHSWPRTQSSQQKGWASSALKN